MWRNKAFTKKEFKTARIVSKSGSIKYYFSSGPNANTKIGKYELLLWCDEELDGTEDQKLHDDSW